MSHRTRSIHWLFSTLALAALLVPFAFAFAQYDEEDFERWARRGGFDSETREAIEDLDEGEVESLPIPVLLGVELRNLTKNFGDPRDGGSRTHEGLDIMAPKGTPIASPTEAVVTRIGEDSGSGIYVRTANPGGESFVYMHLDKVADDIDRGDVLKRGDIIGFVGNTGNASGGAAHLHFEIREDGAQDPYPRLQETFSTAERTRGLEEALEEGGDEYEDMYKTRFASTYYALRAEEAREEGGGVFAFTRNLELGMTGVDVRELQKFLNARGFIVAENGAGAPGFESDYFGAKTKDALARYQASQGITPAVGYLGPITRAKIALTKI